MSLLLFVVVRNRKIADWVFVEKVTLGDCSLQGVARQQPRESRLNHRFGLLQDLFLLLMIEPLLLLLDHVLFDVEPLCQVPKNLEIGNLFLELVRANGGQL